MFFNAAEDYFIEIRLRMESIGKDWLQLNVTLNVQNTITYKINRLKIAAVFSAMFSAHVSSVYFKL